LNLIILLGAVFLLTDPQKVSAVDTNQGPVFTITEENDLVVDTDRHYTQGIKLSYLHSENHVPHWLETFSEKLPAIGFTASANRIGTQVGQNIYTPANISVTNLQSGDRPYAGWLYTGLIFQRRGLAAKRIPTLEHFQLDLGIIGPDSLAEEAQTWIHELRGFETPKGWDHQLHDEPGVALKYQRSWLLSPSADNPRYLDFIPHLGASLGNVETSFRMGATVRLGINLPDDFGVQTISSLMASEGGWSHDKKGGRWGFYAFSGLEGSAVGYTAFLDGNLFQSSPHVEHEPFVAEWKTGFVLVLSRVDTGFSYVYRTREFIGQQRDNGYGSVFAKIKF
jgi:hypothetical protein